jgi:Flp pilus assembly protein CpaB
MKSTLFYVLAGFLVSMEGPPDNDPNHRQMRGIAVYVETVKGGTLQPGSLVDVVHTIASPKKSASKVILENIFVRGFEPALPEAKKGPGVLVVTLEVDIKQSLTLCAAKENGSFTLLLRPVPGLVEKKADQGRDSQKNGSRPR